MKCAHVEELLPLYVHADLDAGRTGAVKAHLQACPDCGQLAEEFEQVHQWMGLYEPPDFGDDVYSSIRRNVLNEIERAAAKPGLYQLFSSLFQPRALALAAALCLFIFGALFAFKFYSDGKTNVTTGELASARPSDSPARETIVSPPAVDSSVPANSTPIDGSSIPFNGMRASRDAAPSSRLKRKPSPQPALARRTLSAGTVARTTADETREMDARELASGEVAEVRVPAATGASPVAAGPGGNPVATSPNSLRVELQTGDPKIRIIWFAPQVNDAR